MSGCFTFTYDYVTREAAIIDRIYTEGIQTGGGGMQMHAVNNYVQTHRQDKTDRQSAA